MKRIEVETEQELNNRLEGLLTTRWQSGGIKFVHPALNQVDLSYSILLDQHLFLFPPSLIHPSDSTSLAPKTSRLVF